MFLKLRNPTPHTQGVPPPPPALPPAHARWRSSVREAAAQRSAANLTAGGADAPAAPPTLAKAMPSDRDPPDSQRSDQSGPDQWLKSLFGTLGL